MYRIGELSKLCNISVKALRYYDAQGLLIPDKIDKFTGYRIIPLQNWWIATV